MMFMLMVSILMSIEDDKLFFMGKVPRKQTLWWVKGRGEEGHEKNEKIADSPQFAPDSQVSIPNTALLELSVSIMLYYFRQATVPW